MSLTRYFEFTCDFCQTKARREAYGLPKGFIYIRGNSTLKMQPKHACEPCAKDLNIVPASEGTDWEWRS